MSKTTKNDDGPAPAAVDAGPAEAEVSTKPEFTRGDVVVALREPEGPKRKVVNIRHGNRGIYEVQVEGIGNWMPAEGFRKG